MGAFLLNILEKGILRPPYVMIISFSQISPEGGHSRYHFFFEAQALTFVDLFVFNKIFLIIQIAWIKSTYMCVWFRHQEGVKVL